MTFCVLLNFANFSQKRLKWLSFFGSQKVNFSGYFNRILAIIAQI
ncbi:hypothetical protein UNSWCS_1206 [Campylobacter concisus UNSWCS]|uniref:Uncharacterized protein n=1 Tax=Campylobacter concisus UNSWCS TaxID=1242968 RepID=U2GRL8_9BACT|nr:hypothetical protein UNSWCS_1206 [Campylobacter concisus UNSWCS]